MVHVVKDVYKEMRLTYISAAAVNVAVKKGITKIGEGPFQLEIENKEIAEHYPTHFTVLQDGKPYANQMMEVSNTDSATRNLTTNQKGYVAFPKDWNGGQLIQLAYPQRKKGNITEKNTQVIIPFLLILQSLNDSF